MKEKIVPQKRQKILVAATNASCVLVLFRPSQLVAKTLEHCVGNQRLSKVIATMSFPARRIEVSREGLDSNLSDQSL